MDNSKADAAVSTRVKSRKKDVIAYAKNPFWNPYSVKIGTRKVTIAGGMVADPDTGEMMSHAGIHRIELVDEEKFVKVFTRNLKVFFDLSPASQKVLQCVLSVVQSNQNADGIHLPWFTVEDYSLEHELKISRSSFFNAMREMLAKGFLAESEHPNFYWINPHLFFNGDRKIFITEYRRSPSEAKKKSAKSDADTRTDLEKQGQQRLDV